jgi:hypothetical protein
MAFLSGYQSSRELRGKGFESSTKTNMESKLKQGTTGIRRLLNPSHPLVLQAFAPCHSDNAADLTRLEVRVNNEVENQE